MQNDPLDSLLSFFGASCPYLLELGDLIGTRHAHYAALALLALCAGAANAIYLPETAGQSALPETAEDILGLFEAKRRKMRIYEQQKHNGIVIVEG